MKHAPWMTHQAPRWFLSLIASLFVLAAATVSLPSLAMTAPTSWQVSASDLCQGDACGMTQPCAAACAWGVLDHQEPIFEPAPAGRRLAMNQPIPRGRVVAPEPYPPQTSSA